MTQAFPYYVNLLPDQWVRSRASVSAARRWFVVLALTLCFVCVPSVVIAVQMRTAPLPNQGSLGQIREEIRTIEGELPELSDRLSVLLEARRRSELRASRVRWGDILSLVAQAVPENTRLLSFQGTLDTRSLVIQIGVENRSFREAREAVVVLESSGIFDEVEVIESAIVERGDASSAQSSVRLVIASPDADDGGAP